MTDFVVSQLYWGEQYKSRIGGNMCQEATSLSGLQYRLCETKEDCVTIFCGVEKVGEVTSGWANARAGAERDHGNRIRAAIEIRG